MMEKRIPVWLDVDTGIDDAQAILAVEQAMDRYDPALIGYQWDDREPRIQLEPRGQCGYIELRAVRPL